MNDGLRTPAAALRDAGLKVTSIRVAALTLAPAIIERDGTVSTRVLYDALCASGHHTTVGSCYRVLRMLGAARLLPVADLELPGPGGRGRQPRRPCPYVDVLKEVGLQATSARKTVLRLAPAWRRADGTTDLRGLHVAARAEGLTLDAGMFARVVGQLVAVGLLPELS